MILGVGTDLCDIRRIEASLARYGQRFMDRICTEDEQVRARRRPNSAGEYAKLFAAKEACAKALGTGFRQGVYWRDIRLSSHPGGKPTLSLAAGAKARLDALTPFGMEARVEISLTDEHPLAHAIVILFAVPKV